MPDKNVDSAQESLASFAASLQFASLTPDVVHAAKACLIDTLGVLLGGFHGEPCRIARNVAARMATSAGATILGTRLTTTPDMAAFVNATTARYLEFNDVYHYPASAHGHPSDIISPVFAAGEHARASGRDLIVGIVLGYEVYGHISDQFKNPKFDNANFCCAASSLAAGRMLGLSQDQLAHVVAMAVVPNNVLRQVRLERFTAWKEVASGNSARAALFAALLARDGMEGPYLPFQGKAGWADNIAGGPLSFDNLGKDYKILYARPRLRPAMGETHASIYAAEKLGPLRNMNDVREVKVEVYKRAKDLVGTGWHFWNPDTRETADHSLPYVVAAGLMDGAVTPRSFHDDRLWSPELRALLQKIDVVENPGFTEAYHRVPREQRARVSVYMQAGECLVGEAGGDAEDLAVAKSDDRIVDKFRGMAEPLLGRKSADKLLERLWCLEDIDDIARIAEWLVIA